MAKRATAGKTGMNITQEVRSLVEANKEIKGAEVMAVLREKFPKLSLNENSCLVAYSNVRKKLGLTKTVAKRPVGVVRTGKKIGRPPASPSPAAVPAAGSLDISLLQAAKALLQYCKGDVAVAQSALKQVAALQMPHHAAVRRQHQKVSSPGVEPGLRPSQSRVLSLTLRGRVELDYPTEESNLARLLRRQSCILHTRGAIHQRADDWIRTSMNLFTRQAPFSVEPRRHYLLPNPLRGREEQWSPIQTDTGSN